MRKLMFIAIFVVLVMLTGCNQVMGFIEKDYYVYLNEDYNTFHNDQYVYILNGYDEKGNERLITFYTEEPLENNTFVKVRTDLNGYTDIPKEINIGCSRCSNGKN